MLITHDIVGEGLIQPERYKICISFTKIKVQMYKKKIYEHDVGGQKLQCILFLIKRNAYNKLQH